jgi:hypothetical protein
MDNISVTRLALIRDSQCKCMRMSCSDKVDLQRSMTSVSRLRI